MTTRKEHLLANGKIKEIGRGRISLDNLNWLQSEYDKGIRFSDWEPDGQPIIKVKSTIAKKTRNSNTPAPVPEISAEYSDSNILWPESQYRIFERVNGKKVFRSMRDACNNCRVSMVACQCESVGRFPLIVARDGRGSVRVFMEPV